MNNIIAAFAGTSIGFFFLALVLMSWIPLAIGIVLLVISLVVQD